MAAAAPSRGQRRGGGAAGAPALNEPAAQAVLFDQTKGQVLRTLAGHGKKVTTAWFHSEFGGGKALVLTGSADKTVKLWSTGADFSGDACSTVTARQATV